MKLLSITLILFIAGCREKDELTLPVRVNFKIGISPENVYRDTYLSFDRGQIGVKSIRFEGKREAGEDIFFETDPKMNFQILEFSTDENPLISDFDIPQGIFNYMKWDIDLKRIGTTEGLIDYVDTDSLSIGLVISGIYEYLDGSYIRIIIAVDDSEQLSVMSDVTGGNSGIVLSVNKNYYDAILLLAPVDPLHSISRESLEKADISEVSGHQIILISSNENEHLYKNLLYLIAKSARIVFR